MTNIQAVRDRKGKRPKKKGLYGIVAKWRKLRYKYCNKLLQKRGRMERPLFNKLFELIFFEIFQVILCNAILSAEESLFLYRHCVVGNLQFS